MPQAKRRRHRRVPLHERTAVCQGCGCTWDAACPGGCGWDPVLWQAGRAVCTTCTNRGQRVARRAHNA